MSGKDDIEMQKQGGGFAYPPPAFQQQAALYPPPGEPPAYGQPAYGYPPGQPAYGQPAYGQPGFDQGGVYAAPAAAYGAHQDDKSSDSDVEAPPLAPGMDTNETVLRWGFIRKVYCIVGLQLAVTAGISAMLFFVPGPADFLKENWWVMMLLCIGTMLGYIPMFMFRNRHPHNLILLMGWTVLFSFSIGTIVSCYAPVEVVIAFAITAVMVVGLTLFTFIAVRRGMTFRFLEPFLFAGLLGLLVWGVFQFFIYPGPIARGIYCLLAVILFAAYLVFDTELLIKRFPIDEYIFAAMNIYIDIIQIFIYLLQIIGIINNN